MTSTDMFSVSQTPALRNKIRGLGGAIRWAAVVWRLWGLGLLSWQWTHRAKFDEQISKLYQIDASAIPDERYFGAAAVSFTSWAATAALVATIWRLAQSLIDGRYFMPEAAQRLRLVAMTGFAATAIDIVARPIGAATLSSELLAKVPSYFWLRPSDMLYALICGFFLAPSSIFAEASASNVKS